VGERDDTGATSATTAPARRRLDPGERSEQILAAATAVFRDQEYPAVSLDAVASAAGVTRGLLHHYFGSKRDLYLAVVERQVRVPPDMRIVPDGASGDLGEVLAVCVDGWLAAIEAVGGLWAGAAGGGGMADPDVDAVVTRARDELVERMLVEVPFPAELDRDLLRSALRCFAALARVASEEWLVAGTLTRAQAAALLHRTLLGLATDAVPAMGRAAGEAGSGSLSGARGAGPTHARR